MHGRGGRASERNVGPECDVSSADRLLVLEDVAAQGRCRVRANSEPAQKSSAGAARIERVEEPAARLSLRLDGASCGDLHSDRVLEQTAARQRAVEYHHALGA